MATCANHMFFNSHCHLCNSAQMGEEAARAGERVRDQAHQRRQAESDAAFAREQRARADAQRQAQWIADKPRRDAKNARIRSNRATRWARIAQEDAAAGKPSDALRLRAGIIAAAVTFVVLMGAVGSPGTAHVVTFVAFAVAAIQAILRNSNGGWPNVARIGAREATVLGIMIVGFLLGLHGMSLFSPSSMSTGTFIGRIFGLLIGAGATGAFAYFVRRAPRGVQQQA